MVNWPAKLRQMISGVPMLSHYSNLFLNVGASRNFLSSKYPNWAGNLLHLQHFTTLFPTYKLFAILLRQQ